MLFENSIEHIIRLLRNLRTIAGNSILMGMGGSGRNSLATFACFLADIEIVSVDISNWQEELQKLMKMVGLENRTIALLISDTKLKNDSQFEDLGHLVNNGDVPNLFPQEEKAKICEELSHVIPNLSIVERWNFFLN